MKPGTLVFAYRIYQTSFTILKLLNFISIDEFTPQDDKDTRFYLYAITVYLKLCVAECITVHFWTLKKVEVKTEFV